MEYREYNIRKTTIDDLKEIKNILCLYFGKFPEKHGATDDIENKYMVAIYNNEVVAITGILPLNKSEYDGYEITWTCTKLEHRHKGLIINMLKECEKNLPNDGKPIYCSCWRIKDNKCINMKNVMKSLGYKIKTKNHKTRLFPINEYCSDCIYSEFNCHCVDDLYYKKRDNNI